MTGPVARGLVQQLGGPVHVVGAEHDVDVRRPLPDERRGPSGPGSRPTTICMPGRRSFSDLRWPRVP